MYRRGVVSAVDVATHRARVTFADRDKLESPWLDVLVRDAGDDDDFGLPSVGAQVGVLLEENAETGVVLGALHSKENPPKGTTKSTDVRRLTLKDDAYVEYNRATHKLTISMPAASSELKVDVTGKVHITTSGDTEITPGGLLKVAGADDFVALAQKVDDGFTTIRSAFNAHITAFNAHIHPTGVGPSGPPPPGTACAAIPSVKCSKTKTS